MTDITDPPPDPTPAPAPIEPKGKLDVVIELQVPGEGSWTDNWVSGRIGVFSADNCTRQEAINIVNEFRTRNGETSVTGNWTCTEQV